MKLVLLKNNLVEGLVLIERAISSSSNLPILKNVCIDSKTDRIILRSTNLELAIERVVQGKIVSGGECNAPFSLLYSIIKNITSDRVTLEFKQEKLVITTDNYEAKIQSGLVADFPIIPVIHDATASISIQKNPLQKTLENVVVAAQYSTIRPEISGVFLCFAGGRLAVVATDSFRLVEVFVSEQDFKTESGQFSHIIPLNTAHEMIKVLTNSNDEVVELRFDRNQLVFQTKQTNLTSRLIDGTFPGYQAVIPKDAKNKITTNKNDLLGSIKLVSSLSGTTNDITIRTTENKKAIELYSQNSILGENRCIISAKLEGDPFSTTFNWKYLLDGVRIYDSPEVTIGVTPKRPATITSKTEQHTTYVIMPIDA